jgi:hypothetical protein
MICQLCLARAATHHITDRSPSGRLEEAHYCRRCYRAKYFTPLHHASALPRPKLTRKRIVILAAVWAVANAVTAWIMTCGPLSGTPAEIREWTSEAFLGVNFVLGFFVVCGFWLEWFIQMMWYKRTGGLVPMPKDPPVRQQLAIFVHRVLPAVVWCVAAIFVDEWLTPKIWPNQRINLQLYTLLLWGPLLPIQTLRLSRDRLLRELIQQTWRTASVPERVLRTVMSAWSLGFLLVIMVGCAGLWHWESGPWFILPAVLLIAIVGQIVLGTAAALSIRPR